VRHYLDVTTATRLGLAAAIWTAAWIPLDLWIFGLIEADFSTAGLFQAYSAVLYPLGLALIFTLWAIRRTARIRTRRSVDIAKLS
jgi:hypothetical protein